jgi:hypothetical protein
MDDAAVDWVSLMEARVSQMPTRASEELPVAHRWVRMLLLGMAGTDSVGDKDEEVEREISKTSGRTSKFPRVLESILSLAQVILLSHLMEMKWKW